MLVRVRPLGFSLQGFGPGGANTDAQVYTHVYRILSGSRIGPSFEVLKSLKRGAQ